MNILNDYMTNEMKLSRWEQKIIIFKFKGIVYDLSKFVIMSLFFYCTGYMKEYLFAFMILAPLRAFSGGLHMKHYLSCFLFSFGYFVFLIYGLCPIRLPMTLSVMLLILCSLVNFCLSPIQAPSRPPLTAEEIQSRKQKTFILTVYAALIILLFYHTALALAGFWTIVLHSAQLLIATIRTKGGENHES